MWYRMAQRLARRGLGSFPRARRGLDNIALPSEAEQMAQGATERRTPKPWGERTLEERLEGLPGRNGYMDAPGPIPDALLDREINLPAGIADQHPTVHPSGNASRGPTFTQGFPTNPDPRVRLRLR